MTVHKFGFFDSKSCLVMVLIGLWIACGPSAPQERINTQAQTPASKEASSGLQASPDVISSSDTGTPSNEDVKREDVKVALDLIVEQYMGTRLQLSPKNCRVTAFDIRAPKQVQWTWQLEAAPGSCDFAREPTGALRMIKTNKGNVISVASSKPESATSRWCDTKVVVLVYSHTDHGGQWSVSTEASNMRMCAPQQWDEKMYHVMAQHTRPLH